MGDVVYVELPDSGVQLEQGQTAGAIESVKAASDIYAPVTGTVLEKNDKVEETPTLINKSPYEKGGTFSRTFFAKSRIFQNSFIVLGWLFKVELKDTKQLGGLMDEKAYEIFRSQEHED